MKRDVASRAAAAGLIAAVRRPKPAGRPARPAPAPARIVKVDLKFSPIGLAVDGTTAWVAAALSNKVYPVAVATMRAGTPIAVGKVPLRVAVAKDGVWVSIFDQGGISRVDQPKTILPIGKQAEGIAATAGRCVVGRRPGRPRRGSGRAGFAPAGDRTGTGRCRAAAGRVRRRDRRRGHQLHVRHGHDGRRRYAHPIVASDLLGSTGRGGARQPDRGGVHGIERGGVPRPGDAAGHAPDHRPGPGRRDRLRARRDGAGRAATGTGGGRGRVRATGSWPGSRWPTCRACKGPTSGLQRSRTAVRC